MVLARPPADLPEWWGEGETLRRYPNVCEVPAPVWGQRSWGSEGDWRSCFHIYCLAPRTSSKLVVTLYLVFFLFVGEQHVLIECVCVFVLCVCVLSVVYMLCVSSVHVCVSIPQFPNKQRTWKCYLISSLIRGGETLFLRENLGFDSGGPCLPNTQGQWSQAADSLPHETDCPPEGMLGGLQSL